MGLPSAANEALLFAYVAKASPPEKRTKLMALMSLPRQIGYFVGPALCIVRRQSRLQNRVQLLHAVGAPPLPGKWGRPGQQELRLPSKLTAGDHSDPARYDEWKESYPDTSRILTLVFFLLNLGIE